MRKRKNLTLYEVYDTSNKNDERFRGVFPARSTLQAFKKYLIKSFVNRSDVQKLVKRVSVERGRSLKKSLRIEFMVTTGPYEGDIRGNEFTYEVFLDRILFAKYEW